MRDVSIVIPTWNGRPLLEAFLPSVIAAAELYSLQHASNVEVVIVDDASTDDSKQWLAANYGGNPLLSVLQLKSNVGFLRAANRGFEKACYPIILLLNNDVQVEPNVIAPLVSHFENERLFAVCCKAFRLNTDFLDGGGKIGRFRRGFWRVFFNYDVLPAPNRTPPRYYSFFGSGAYTAYDAEKLSALGGFEDLLAPGYWEDVELCYRAWKRGWIIEYEPASVVHHLSSGTMGTEELRRELVITTERNRLVMTWINLHDRVWLASHVLWLLLKLAGACLSLKWAYWRSFLQAVSGFRGIIEARRRERAASTRSDRDIAGVFQDLTANECIYVIDNVRDYQEFLNLERNMNNEGRRIDASGRV